MIVYQKARKVYQNSTYGRFLVFVLESTLVMSAFEPMEDPKFLLFRTNPKFLLKDGDINLCQNLSDFQISINCRPYMSDTSPPKQLL